MTDGFVWDVGTPQQRTAPRAEAEQLLREMEAAFTSPATRQRLLYSHQARDGAAAAQTGHLPAAGGPAPSSWGQPHPPFQLSPRLRSGAPATS